MRKEAPELPGKSGWLGGFSVIRFYTFQPRQILKNRAMEGMIEDAEKHHRRLLDYDAR